MVRRLLSFLGFLKRTTLRTGAVAIPAGAALVISSGGPQVDLFLTMSQPAIQQEPRRDIADFGRVLKDRSGRIGVAIYNSSQNVIYQSSGSNLHTLASVSKVYILLTYLDLLAREQREPDEDELFWMEAMIEESDNPSATQLWDISGGYDGIRDFLVEKGMPPPEAPPVDDEWGAMRASALDLGVILASLYRGRLLDPERTAFALDLLANVIEAQSWGVGVARGETGLPKAYLKNGWYPEEDGWIVNSVGIVEGRLGDYIIVVLTDEQPTLEAGVAFIEAAVAFVRERLL